MELEFDNTNTIFNDQITPRDFYIRTYDIGHFLLNHNHPIIDELKPILFGKYRVVMKFIQYRPQGSIWVSNQWLIARKAKFAPISVAKGVKLIEGTPTRSGGSNNYPIPCFKEGYCVLEFTSYGLPITSPDSGWRSEIISMEKIQ